MEEVQTPTRPARILNLQILRFVAAAAVLISHTADVTEAGDTVFWSVPWTAGVDIFFVISGILMTILTANCFGRPDVARRFLVRRIIRIVPIYWLFTLLMIAVILIMPGQVKHSQADPGSVISSMLFVPWTRLDGYIVPVLGQGWTLNYELYFYLAFAIALLHRHGLVILVGFFILLAGSHCLIPERLVGAFFWSDPVILEFVAGIGIARLWLGGLRMGFMAQCVMAAVSAMLFLGAGWLGLEVFNRLIARGIPAALLAATFLLRDGTGTPGPLRRALIAGGDASYALYLSHTFTINLVVLALGESLRGWSAFAIASTAAVAVSLLVHRLVERPILRTLRRRYAEAG